MPDNKHESGAREKPDSEPTPIYLCSGSFPGTQLEPQQFSDHLATAYHNSQDSQNSISLSTVLPLIPPSERESLRQQASSQQVHVTLGWRLTRNPYPVFQTRHLLTTEESDVTTTRSTVVFTKDLSWAKTIVQNNQKFTNVQQQAAQAASQAPRQQASRHCRHCQPATHSSHIRHWQNHHHQRFQAHKRTLHGHRDLRQLRAQQSGGTGATANNPLNGGIAPNSRHAHCLRLISALRRHAEAVYNETGDTSELLRVTRLSQRMAQCRVRGLSAGRGGGKNHGGGEDVA